MANRRDDLLDAAIRVIGESGIRGATHRAVDAAVGLPAGSTSNYFRSRDALLNAVVERFAIRERENWEEIAARLCPTTPAELVSALVEYIQDSVGPQRTLTLTRYVILLESAIHPPLRERLLSGGSRVRTWVMNWLRVVGSADPQRDAPILMNHASGLVLHQLAVPDPAFDPTDEITTLLTAVLSTPPNDKPRSTNVSHRPAGRATTA